MGDLTDIRTARELRTRLGHARPLERAAVRGELVRVRPGAYVSADEWELASNEERHRLLAALAAERCRTPPVFSHETAAALHGIPVIGEWPHRPVATAPRGHSLSSSAIERVHRSLDPHEIVRTDEGLLATSPARTVVDLACRRSQLSAIVAVSGARHAGTSLEDIHAAAAAAGRMPGIRAARIAISASSGSSESPLESLVLVRCRDLGFETPLQQFLMRGVDGVRYRVDFAWREGAILAEADGKLKYRGEPGRRTPADVLWAEKQREDALRARVRAFIRITWDDAWTGAGLERLLVAAGVPRVGMPSRTLTW